VPKTNFAALNQTTSTTNLLILLVYFQKMVALLPRRGHYSSKHKPHGGLSMRPISQLLTDDVAATVRAEYFELGIVNVSTLSEAIRLRHERENVALEDIAEMVMDQAQIIGAPMEFYTPRTGEEVNRVNGRKHSALGRANLL
jgi:hypothetical protein